MAFQPPVVDELSVRVVVDSRYERFLPKASHPQVCIEHVGRIPGRPDMTFSAEWGLSLHLASMKEGAESRKMQDLTPAALLTHPSRNAAAGTEC